MNGESLKSQDEVDEVLTRFNLDRAAADELCFNSAIEYSFACSSFQARSSHSASRIP